jgi:hypothetical protein
MLGLFFLVGGHAAARSLDRAAARGEGYRAWVRRRLVRLGRPVLAATAALGAVLPVLALAGVPEATLRTTATLVVQPLWFIGVYPAVTALTPVALALDRRMGVYAAVPGLLVVAGVDCRARVVSFRSACPLIGSGERGNGVVQVRPHEREGKPVRGHFRRPPLSGRAIGARTGPQRWLHRSEPYGSLINASAGYDKQRQVTGVPE